MSLVKNDSITFFLNPFSQSFIFKLISYYLYLLLFSPGTEVSKHAALLRLVHLALYSPFLSERWYVESIPAYWEKPFLFYMHSYSSPFKRIQFLNRCGDMIITHTHIHTYIHTHTNTHGHACTRTHAQLWYMHIHAKAHILLHRGAAQALSAFTADHQEGQCALVSTLTPPPTTDERSIGNLALFLIFLNIIFWKIIFYYYYD